MSFKKPEKELPVIDAAQVVIIRFVDAHPHAYGVHEDDIRNSFHSNGARGANFFDSVRDLKNQNAMTSGYMVGAIAPNYKLTVLGERMADSLAGRNTRIVEHVAALCVLRGVHNGRLDFMEPEVAGIGPTRALGIVTALSLTGYLEPAPDFANPDRVPFAVTQRGRTVLDHYSHQP